MPGHLRDPWRNLFFRLEAAGPEEDFSVELGGFVTRNHLVSLLSLEMRNKQPMAPSEPAKGGVGREPPLPAHSGRWGTQPPAGTPGALPLPPTSPLATWARRRREAKKPRAASPPTVPFLPGSPGLSAAPRSTPALTAADSGSPGGSPSGGGRAARRGWQQPPGAEARREHGRAWLCTAGTDTDTDTDTDTARAPP